MFKEGDFDDDFNDIDDMMNEAIKNVEGDTANAGGVVNTATTRVSAASALVTTASVSISTAEPRTPTTTTTTIFKDDDLTIAQTLIKTRSEKAKEKGVAFRDVEESARSTKIIQRDAEIAQRLFEEEQAQFEREQRIAKERATEQEARDAALIEQIEDVQARMDADNAGRFDCRKEEVLCCTERYTHNQLKSKSFEEIKKLYEREQKWINDFVPMDFEVVKDSGKKDDDSQKQVESSKKRPRAENDEESVKKQKFEDDAEKEELRAYLDIVPWDDIAVNIESLATKYLIVDRKTHILTENMMYYQIIRADGSSKNYKIFSEMLDDFDRQDVVDLYSLVKERVAIHMLVEKKYPLTQEMLSRMLNRILEVDHESTMAFELIKFIKEQLEE
ncbi:hypothetical protein Tco_1341892 [Tanacetum coccineum]